MARLQGIVWPEIRLLAEARIEGLGREGAESVVLEAAVLLEAGWDGLCDELWVVQVPPAVARYVYIMDVVRYLLRFFVGYVWGCCSTDGVR